MAHHVEKRMHEMVEPLDDLKRKRIFDEEEIRHIIKRRRDFEYQLQKRPSKHQDYLNYARYEIALETLRWRRNKALGWKKYTISDNAGLGHIRGIFDRAVIRFKGDMRMWYQYIDFCLRTGSTKIMSRTILRALKIHPHEVHLWLLAADRELKLGNIKSARSLLIRALRFVPTSAKLWSEILRMEIRVAISLRETREPDAEAKDGEENNVPLNPWGPAGLLFRKAVSRLENKPEALLAFLTQAVGCLLEAQRDLPEHAAGPDALLENWAKEIRTTLAESRPKVGGNQEMLEAFPTAIAGLWSLWWNHERHLSARWNDIVDGSSELAPPPAIQELANILAEAAAKGAKDEETENSTAGMALAKLAEQPCVCDNADSSLAVLRSIERCCEPASGECKEGKEAASKAATNLLEKSSAAHPANARLAMLAWKGAKSGATLPRVEGRSWLPQEGAARLLLDATQSVPSGNVLCLEIVLRSVHPKEDPTPVVMAHLSAAMAESGPDGVKKAAEEVRRAGMKMWDIPGRHAAVLAAALDGELRCLQAASSDWSLKRFAQEAKLIGGHFEELLAKFPDEKVQKEDWTIRFMEFAHTCSCIQGSVIPGLPTVMDLHWRAMRFVSDQGRYMTKSQQLMRLQGGGAA